MTRIFDLSVPIEDTPSEPQPLKVEHKAHEASMPLIKLLFGVEEKDLADGLGWADDAVSLSAHSGTHVDAPWHYSPISENKKSRTIDEMPLEWFYHDGVVLDFRHKPQGSGISVDEVKVALKNFKALVQ